MMKQIESNNANSLENVDSIETYLQNCKNKPTLYLTDDMMFKITTICLMSISRLKSKESSEVQGVVAITLAILSQLLQITITRLQEMVTDTAVPTMETTAKAETYFAKLKNGQERQTSYEQENNGDHLENEDSAVNKDNNVFNLNKNDKAKSLDNGVANESSVKKTRDKSKSLLNKLRRRKRRTSSDSDASDLDQSTLASSSDEINSDVSETEGDDAISDDALSDDNTDDEESLLGNKVQTKNTTKEEINGHVSDVTSQTKNCENNDVNHINGEQHTTDQQMDLKVIDNKDSVTNSSSTVTITTNTDSISTSEESNGDLCAANGAVSHVTQLKKQNLKPDDILSLLIDKEILASIKVCCDWLQSNHDIVRICAKSSRTLLKRITILLNLIDIDAKAFVRKTGDSTILSSAERLKECVKTVPLPEDIDLKGLNLLEDAHKSLDWHILHKHKMNKHEETLLRVLKLIEFGHHLSSIENSGMRYDQTEQLFLVTDSSPSNAPKATGLDEKNFGSDHSKKKLMRHMGKLWLKAEVRALENQLCCRFISPYLVPDHEALAKYMPALKRLVHAKKFIVVIPAVGK
jgi:protein SMG5